LITAGGTREPIDSVRYIGNSSTGRTAAALANALASKGHEVTWLGAEQAIRPGENSKQETYVTFHDLESTLRRLLGNHSFDVAIHAAAVSDFSVDSIQLDDANREPGPTKLPSSKGLSLHLKPNPKLLDQLRSWSVNPDIRIIGFKLTHGASPQQRQEAVARLLAGATTDAVVHNDLEDMRDGRHPFTLYSPHADSTYCADSQELAGQIEHLMESMA
jgi:phosphopantothenoylcysteine decarboxylase/phosphopantothenate--cysteine ligase